MESMDEMPKAHSVSENWIWNTIYQVSSLQNFQVLGKKLYRDITRKSNANAHRQTAILGNLIVRLFVFVFFLSI